MVSVYDFIRTATMVIGVGFTAQQDRKTWLWGDSMLWGAYAVGLFLFPGYLVTLTLRILLDFRIYPQLLTIFGNYKFQSSAVFGL